jgi:hypothetical protein
MFKQISFWILLFLAAFVVNGIWEEFHSVLYLHYKGGEITHLILLHASLADGLFITSLFALVLFLKRVWLFPVLAVSLAISIEWWALESSRWVYSENMPIIPFLEIGLTPTLQLALTGTFAYVMSLKTYRRFLI